MLKKRIPQKESERPNGQKCLNVSLLSCNMVCLEVCCIDTKCFDVNLECCFHGKLFLVCDDRANEEGPNVGGVDSGWIGTEDLPAGISLEIDLPLNRPGVPEVMVMLLMSPYLLGSSSSGLRSSSSSLCPSLFFNSLLFVSEKTQSLTECTVVKQTTVSVALRQLSYIPRRATS